jgi:hypothetical protein
MRADGYGNGSSATDRQLDRLVYEPCGLTEDEIAVVERRESVAA